MLHLVRTSILECWSLSNIDQSPDASVTLLDLGTHPHIYPLPGCLVVPTNVGVYILDPITLAPLPCKMLQARDDGPHSEDDSIDDSIPRPQFDITDCTVRILSVFDVNWPSNKRDKQNTNSNTAGSPSSSTLVTKVTPVNDQSYVCCVAMAINYRLIVTKIMRRYKYCCECCLYII